MTVRAFYISWSHIIRPKSLVLRFLADRIFSQGQNTFPEAKPGPQRPPGPQWTRAFILSNHCSLPCLVRREDRQRREDGVGPWQSRRPCLSAFAPQSGSHWLLALVARTELARLWGDPSFCFMPPFVGLLRAHWGPRNGLPGHTPALCGLGLLDCTNTKCDD